MQSKNNRSSIELNLKKLKHVDLTFRNLDTSIDCNQESEDHFSFMRVISDFEHSEGSITLTLNSHLSPCITHDDGKISIATNLSNAMDAMALGSALQKILIQHTNYEGNEWHQTHLFEKVVVSKLEEGFSVLLSPSNQI